VKSNMATSNRNAELQAQYNQKKENLQAVCLEFGRYSDLVARGKAE
jgi:hypothetical protein